MQTTPRIRPDLKATPIEEAGVHYFDVADPRNGASMRLYDFEWLIAERMDGRTALSDVAAWAGSRFGFAPTPDDLAAYAARLAELGFVDASAGDGAAAAPQPAMITPRAVEIAIDDEPEVEITNPATPTAMANATTAPTRLPEPPRVEIEPEPEPAHMPPPQVTVREPPPPPRRSEPPPSRTRDATTDTGRTPATAAKRTTWPYWLLFLALLGVGGYFAYDKIIAPAMEPVKVKVQLAPAARDVVRYYDGKATVARSEPLTLAFGENGKVADVVAPGTDAKAGMTLASLEAAAAIEKELTDVRDREGFYAGQLKAAQAKGNAEEAKKFEEKVAEKTKRIAQLEEHLKKVRLVAPGTAQVAEVLVSAGAEVKEGNPAVKLVDKRMVAEFKLQPADAAAFKAGAQVSVSAGGAPAAARVLSVAGGAVKVELLDDGGGAVKAGDQVSLVRSRTGNVIVVPAAALVKSQGGADQVYVLSGGVARARQVILDGKSENEAYVKAGLTTGDSVVVSPVETLQDGQKAVAEQ